MPLVSAEAALSEGHSLLDVRPAAAFAEGHAANALGIPAPEWEDLLKAGNIDKPDVWRDRLGAFGLDGTPVTIYDDGTTTPASRAWLLLSALLVPARVISGGWPALQASSRLKVETGAVTPQRRQFKGGASLPYTVEVLGRQAVKASLGSIEILDVRTADEFAGIDMKNNTRGGHIPGAINLDHRKLLVDGKSLRDTQEMDQLLAKAGITGQKKIVTMCQGGGRAALAALGAAAVGHRNIAVYYPSFGDWAKDASCPVVKP